MKCEKYSRLESEVEFLRDLLKAAVGGGASSSQRDPQEAMAAMAGTLEGLRAEDEHEKDADVMAASGVTPSLVDRANQIWGADPEPPETTQWFSLAPPKPAEEAQ